MLIVWDVKPVWPNPSHITASALLYESAEKSKWLQVARTERPVLTSPLKSHDASLASFSSRCASFELRCSRGRHDPFFVFLELLVNQIAGSISKFVRLNSYPSIFSDDLLRDVLN